MLSRICGYLHDAIFEVEEVEQLRQECNTGTMGEPPASFALIQIGAPAIPQLSKALMTDPNGYKRVKIALCLGRIGGPKAIVALRRSLRTEPEKDVRERIKFILDQMR